MVGEDPAENPATSGVESARSSNNEEMIEKGIAPPHGVDTLETRSRQVEELKFILGRYYERVLESEEEIKQLEEKVAQLEEAKVANDQVLGMPFRDAEELELFRLMSSRHVVRLAKRGKSAVATPWRKQRLRHPFRFGEWIALRRAQRRLGKARFSKDISPLIE